jgi:dipeptidase E
VKLLLTSGGVENDSIRDALVEMLVKPISECDALVIPTAIYASPGGMTSAWRLITGRARTPLVDIGWKSVGVLELTALPSVDEEAWMPAVRAADVLLVGGGDPLYLAHWTRESGLAALLPSLENVVWLGVSAGSMAAGPSIAERLIEWRPPSGGNNALGFVNFSIFTHLDHPNIPEASMSEAEKWAADESVPCYAIDDQTAIRVSDGNVDVISEGHWRLF